MDQQSTHMSVVKTLSSIHVSDNGHSPVIHSHCTLPAWPSKTAVKTEAKVVGTKQTG